MVVTKPLELRGNLKKYLDLAFNGNLVIVVRPKSENVVIISEQEYNELMELKNR